MLQWQNQSVKGLQTCFRSDEGRPGVQLTFESFRMALLMTEQVTGKFKIDSFVLYFPPARRPPLIGTYAGPVYSRIPITSGLVSLAFFLQAYSSDRGTRTERQGGRR
jgi:hypothetical protein